MALFGDATIPHDAQVAKMRDIQAQLRELERHFLEERIGLIREW